MADQSFRLVERRSMLRANIFLLECVGVLALQLAALQRYVAPAVHLHRDAATRRDLFRDLSERLTETYYRQPALVDDDDVAAQVRRASSRSSTGEWDLEALGEPELARTTTPLV